MIHTIEFKERNLTSHAGAFLLLEHASRKGIFDLIDEGLVFENESTNKVKMNHVRILLCGHFIGIDRLERLKLIQRDTLIREFNIAIKEPETVSRFLSNFGYKTTQMLREINFAVFRTLLDKSGLRSVTIDIDSSVVNVEGHQEGTARVYNPKKPGNPCYNIQFAFCDEIKAFLTGYVRSGDTYTVNGAAELIKEIVAHLQETRVKVTFRMDSGYFDEEILETVESLGCQYVIKGKAYPTLVERVRDPGVLFNKGEGSHETADLVATLNVWEKERRFVVSRVEKPERDRAQLSFLEGEAFEYFFFVTNTGLSAERVVTFYEKCGNSENYIKEAKYDMVVGHLLLKSFWANEAIFQLMMLAYNLFLMFKMYRLKRAEYREQIRTFRWKYVFLAGKIVRSARRVTMKLPEGYPYRGAYESGWL